VPEEWRNTSGYYTPYCLEGSVIVLNKTLCAGLDVAGYADLLSEKLAGRSPWPTPTPLHLGLPISRTSLLVLVATSRMMRGRSCRSSWPRRGGAFVARSSEVYGKRGRGVVECGPLV